MAAQTETAEPNVVNGINVDDLFALIDGVRDDPAKGKTNWRVTTTWQGQTRSRAQVEGFGIGGEKVPRRFSIDIDEPCELGGSNRFANPQEHLLAALNACMMVGYVAQCAVRGITLESLEIDTDGEIDLRGFLGIDPAVPPGYENLSYTVRIKGNGTKEQFAEIHKMRDGDLAQFLQRVPAGGPQTDSRSRVTDARKGECRRQLIVVVIERLKEALDVFQGRFCSQFPILTDGGGWRDYGIGAGWLRYYRGATRGAGKAGAGQQRPLRTPSPGSHLCRGDLSKDRKRVGVPGRGKGLETPR